MEGLTVSTLVGAALPPIVSWVRSKFGVSSKKTYWIAIFVSIITGVAVTYFDGGLSGDPEILLANMGIAFAASQTVYHQFWKGSELEKLVK